MFHDEFIKIVESESMLEKEEKQKTIKKKRIKNQSRFIFNYLKSI